MKSYFKKINSLCLILVLSFVHVQHIAGQDHPKLILTQEGVLAIKKELGKVPFFDSSLAKVKEEVDQEIDFGIVVPVPKDFSGGYTHERHKRNFLMMQKAGLLFQILEDEKYAVYIKDMLFTYAKMYPDLPVHPQERSYARGKLFWQCLNDSNWLVYVSQAYDCIYDWLKPQEVAFLNKELFRPYADFISVGNPQFFNRIHNHSTWGNVAVGMIGLVMDDDELVNRALYGIDSDNIEPGQKDNDGGLIRQEGQKAGFLANLEEPFSPDGYYTEGPYYQRYAMYPFMVFAEALENVKPELKIFEYKGGVLIKAVYALLNLTDTKGEFYPLNDAQKGMSYLSRELITAVNVAYYFGGKDPQLLSIAKLQGKVLLDDTGLEVAKGIENNLTQPFAKKSIELRDGSDGTEGGIAILRSLKNKDELSLVFKYAAQGLSHGHYDKLSFSLYENSEEIIQDYGLARFVNIEQKGGGNYLSENKSWAKQSIAHNTLIQDQESHFKGDFETGNKYHSKKYLIDLKNENLQVVSAYEENAYPGSTLHRTIAFIDDSSLDQPLVLDIFKVDADTVHQYDLPYYFKGQVISTSFELKSNENLSVLGEKNGYQHLWLEGKAISSDANLKMTWYQKNKFYSLTSLSQEGDEILMARIGAKDPEFNLRRDPGIILRREGIKNACFVSIIESHGHYDPVSEIATNAYSSIERLKLEYSDENYVAISWSFVNGDDKIFVFALGNASSEQKHSITINGNAYQWTGAYYYN